MFIFYFKLEVHLYILLNNNHLQLNLEFGP